MPKNKPNKGEEMFVPKNYRAPKEIGEDTRRRDFPPLWVSQNNVFK